ncbi:hypothetical protein HWV62_17804 [Athelia sp. TMB]|nr:hypothetical protein HWV62_17804 [Athelia sp. TMB]
MVNSAESGDFGLPTFNLNEFALHLPKGADPHQISSPVPRVRVTSTTKRNARIVRPSTASAIEEKAALLPSAPTGTVFEVTAPNARTGTDYVIHRGVSLGAQDDAASSNITPISSCQTSGVHSQYVPAYRYTDFRIVGDSQPCSDLTGLSGIAIGGGSEGALETVAYDYDWATFMTAYAAGRWDPHRTPNPPRSSINAPSESTFVDPWAMAAGDDIKRSSLPLLQKPGASSPAHQPTHILVSTSEFHTSPAEELPPPPIPTNLGKLAMKRSALPLKLPPSALHHVRNSFSDLRLSHDSTSSSVHFEVGAGHSAPDVATAAATMRWAAARVNLSPLALPSPEHELTDPMRGVTASLPSSFQEPPTPGEARKIRLASFWEGTRDVEESPSKHLPTIEASPSSSRRSSPLMEHPPPVPIMPFPASAPLLRGTAEVDQDYFAIPGSSPDDIHNPTQETPVVNLRPNSPGEMGTVSVPAVGRRASLMRQTSSPLPESSRLSRYTPDRANSQHHSPASHQKGGRAAREEQVYAEFGYLIPPNPPDEWKRRRALSKDDEPLVVLDALADWRFANHPSVISRPRIRFYAGAPLRTQDGYNVGTLSVLDDCPREEFSPRERHTLKEFAVGQILSIRVFALNRLIQAIVMREMELWRDKMEQFSRECLEIETTAADQEEESHKEFVAGASMERVYDRAAKLVKRTLDVEGVIVMDISHCEVVETVGAEGTVSVVIHYGDPQMEMRSRTLSQEDYSKLATFFHANPDGRISEGIVPPSLRPFLPTHIQYALTVPIFNIDKRPFALLCAYNSVDHPTRYLEGHELSYLRAIGVIILSAVLKRRMILADKSKSLFISNISHELRTPLHGILAAAELLTDTRLDSNQVSFLQTVQACGTSLVETVNHVLDFTKLSGNSKSGGVDNVIVPSRVDLMQLVEEAVDGGWIGHRARMSAQNSEIGSVYSPPSAEQKAKDKATDVCGKHVETVIEVGYRESGWLFKCERGGIRRVLMNLLGNSLKFTTDGFVHVGLRQLSSTHGGKNVKIELSVLDTGKGISQSFLKNHMFHPFSQENPLQTGTGLGLAIVNSIVRSESVGGKIEVWSEEGVGTEIKVIFDAEAVVPDHAHGRIEPLVLDEFEKAPTVSLLAFDLNHKGVKSMHRVLAGYLTTWWGFVVQGSDEQIGDIVIVNEDPTPVDLATRRKDYTRPFIILSESRGDQKIMAIANEHERMGGFCRVLYKPGGPSRLRSALQVCLNVLRIRQTQESNADTEKTSPQPTVSDDIALETSRPPNGGGWHIPSLKTRRHSEEGQAVQHGESSQSAPARDNHVNNRPAIARLPSTIEIDEPSRTSSLDPDGLHDESQVDDMGPTIPIGPGGSLLKTSIGTINSEGLHYRVLVVEDNSILRNLLIQWLKARGHQYRDAVDGKDGVNVFASEGPFDVILLDMSMPVLDGIGATMEIRRIEASQGHAMNKQERVRILALTGMSSLEDKRRAFEAGVDGYLVKPVAFKTLDEMFRQLSASK